MEIRSLTRDELNSALDFVWKVFCEYEAANYTEASGQAFYDAVHSEVYKRLGFQQTGEETEDGGIIYIPMEYHHFMDILQDKDDDAAYAATKRIAAESEFSDEYYKFIPEFVELLDHKKSYIRTRAMILCCSQARWDSDGIIAKYLPQMLRLVHDEKPTVVRQSLNALKEIVVFRPELCDVVAAELERMDISGYKESMISLIRKDINELKEKTICN